jgi:hypothetical protein
MKGPHVADQVRDVDAVMQKSGWTYEIIVVDDGSKDDTSANAAKTPARVLRRARNQGYGAALKLGIRHAQYDWILITDADGTYPVAAIPEILARAEMNDMVVGARVGAEVSIPWERRPAKWFLKKLASYLAERDLVDINSGLRLMRKKLVERYEFLLPQGFSFTTTITLSCACNGHAMEYVPIDYAARLGNSKIRARHAYDFTLLIVRDDRVLQSAQGLPPGGGGALCRGAGEARLRHLQGQTSPRARCWRSSGRCWCGRSGCWPTRTSAFRRSDEGTYQGRRQHRAARPPLLGPPLGPARGGVPAPVAARVAGGSWPASSPGTCWAW